MRGKQGPSGNGFLSQLPSKNVTSAGANGIGLITLRISEDHRCGLWWAAAGSSIKQDIHSLCSGTA